MLLLDSMCTAAAPDSPWSMAWIATFVSAVLWIFGFLVPAQLALERRYHATPRITDMPELPDVVRDNVNRAYWERWNSVADCVSLIMPAAAFVSAPAEFALAVRMYVLFMTCRLVLCNVTIMPAGSNLSTKLWRGGERSPRAFSHDLIVSGHTGIMSLCWWLLYATHAQPTWWLVTTGAVTLSGSFLIVLAHQHYTIDMLLGLLLSSALAISYLQC